MLDPRRIWRPIYTPASGQRTVLTSRTIGRNTALHSHRVSVDEEGNGNTDIRVGHFHRVISGRVIPSPVDSHVHELVYTTGGASR